MLLREWLKEKSLKISTLEMSLASRTVVCALRPGLNTPQPLAFLMGPPLGAVLCPRARSTAVDSSSRAVWWLGKGKSAQERSWEPALLPAGTILRSSAAE